MIVNHRQNAARLAIARAMRGFTRAVAVGDTEMSIAQAERLAHAATVWAESMRTDPPIILPE